MSCFIDVEDIVLKLASGPLCGLREVQRLIRDKAEEDIAEGKPVRVDDEHNRFMWPKENVYDVLCSLSRGVLREVVRAECVARSLPVPLEPPSGALAIALHYDQMSLDENVDEESKQRSRDFAFCWYQRAVVGDKNNNIASAGIMRMLFRNEKALTKEKADRRSLTVPASQQVGLHHIALNGLAFYRDQLLLADGQFRDWAMQTLTPFLLSFAGLLVTEDTCYYHSFKYWIQEQTRKLCVFSAGAYLVEGFLLLENYQFYTRHEKEAAGLIRDAAIAFDRPDWIVAANDKVEKNRQLGLHYAQLALTRDREEHPDSFEEDDY